VALLSENRKRHEPQFQIEQKYMHKSGSIVHVLCRGIYDKCADFTRLVGCHTDITSLKKAKEDAIRASQAKSLFLANMSHEVSATAGCDARRPAV
jgi:hypothetical protein